MEQVLLVDLDMLLDTRLATVARLNADQAAALIETTYRERVNDDFRRLIDGFDQEAFRSLYRERGEDTLTLQMARPTGFVVALAMICNSLQKQMIETPLVDSITVEINTWPYTFTEDEKEALVESISTYTSIDTKVRATRLSPQQITPALLKEHYAAYALYELDHWLCTHIDELKQVKIPTVTMFAPALYVGDPPDDDDITVTGQGPINPFGALELSLSEYVTLSMVTPEYVSLVRL